MTTAIFRDQRPMTEADFVAITESQERVELFDGSLHVSPAPTPRHQHVIIELLMALRGPARAAGLDVLIGPNVRLLPHRIPIPDLVITRDLDYDKLVIDASAVVLACEVISPSNAVVDKVTKKHFYAEAGIPWYLLVEQDTCELRLHQLSGTKYIDHSVAGVGEVLRLTEPVVVSIDPIELQPRR